MLLPTNFFPPDTKAFIAGGFAACPALASDIDVWVRVNNVEDVLSMRTVLLDWFRTHGPQTVTEEPETLTADMSRDSDAHYGVLTVKVAKIQRRHQYHVMITTGGVLETLDGFDVTTHMVALTPNGVVRGTYWTPITEPPRAINPNGGTPARMLKIAKRYGHTINQEVSSGETCSV